MGTNTDGNLLVADGTNFNSIAVSSLSEISTAAADDVFIAIDTSGGGLKRISRSAVIAGTGSSGDLANVVEDTSPQLGGNLDMNGADIVTTSNATIDLAPNGTGTVVVRGNTNSGAIVFNCESNSHGQTVIAQPHSASVTNTMLLPAGASSTLVSLVSTDTLTNKTLTSPKINEDVAVTSTATEINALDGITAVVGELNALDIGSTAVGTAVASKAVILDSNKDYTGIRNFTVSGELDAATGDFSGDVDVDGTLEADAITINGTAIASVLSPIAGSSSIVTTGALDTGSITSGFGAIDNGTSGIRTNTFTAETSFVPDAQDGAALGTTSLQFSDLFLADGAVIGMGDDNEVTLTHVADTGVTLNSTNKLMFNDASQFIQGASGTVLDIAATDEIELTATLIDVVGNLAGSGTGTFGGILKTDDATEATSTTDGSLQTDGGLSVVKDVIFGDDVTLISDAAVLKFCANAEVTLTHVHNDGLLLNADMQLQFRDSAINIRSDADGDLDINADDEVEINSTLIDINGNVEMSGTLAQAGVATFAVAANVAQVALTSSSNAIAWNASAAANAYHLTTENTTFSAPSNAVEGAFIAVEINYNGSHTIAFNTVFEFAASTAPTTTDTDGKTDILVFRYNGAVWQEVGRTLNLAES